MRKIVGPKHRARVCDGVSKRVRFASHEQHNLVKKAAKHRGLSRDEFIQRVLQAAAEAVLAAPPPVDSLPEQASRAAAAQL